MKRRYLLVKIICNKTLSDEHFRDALADSVRRYFGEIGFSRIGPRLVRVDHNTSTAIVCCNQGEVSQLESALALISEHLEEPVAPLVLRVSGTIKALRKHPVR
jgi:RNase P/RNase MRP subunit POP5